MKQAAHSIDQAVNSAERHLAAIAVSRGIGIGRIAFLDGEKRQFFRIDLEPSQIDAEISRLRQAVAESIRQLSELAANRDPDKHRSISDIFGVHLLIIEESSFIEKIETVIQDIAVNAEWAIKTVSNRYLKQQGSVPGDHFREKYLDIEDVADRLLTSLNGSRPAVHLTEPDAVIVVHELRPSAIMELAKSKPAAVITERGGWTSHASILAREFALPMVTGIHDLEQVLLQRDLVIVDGINGQVIVNPNHETIASFRAVIADNGLAVFLPEGSNKGTLTRDGTEIVIRANIDLPDAYNMAEKLGARGIGLYRSESLITLPGVIPTEDEQFAAYRKIAGIAGDAGVRIRTFDIGLDLAGGNRSTERNPSLGLRAIRLSLSDSAHFRTQIRAILRAAASHKIDIVLPMITGVAEIVRSKDIIKEERELLVNAGISVGDPGIGAMIEVPSAVFTVREIAGQADFLCLGTNDLVQYLLAVDRDNDAVAEWYQTLHPAVIRAIGDVLAACKDAGITVSVCGEMAGSPFYVPLLLGLGARELSVHVNAVRQIRHLVSGITIQKTIDIVDKIRTLETADHIENALREYYLQHWSGLFPTGLLDSKHR